MFLIRPDAASTVVALLGKAVARAPDGSLRMLDVGDRVSADEVVLTARSQDVRLAMASVSRPAGVLSTASPKLVALPDDDAAPAWPTAPAVPTAASLAHRVAALSTAAPKPLAAAPAPTDPDPVPALAEATSGGLQAALRVDGSGLGESARIALAIPSSADAAVRGFARQSAGGDRFSPFADPDRTASTPEDTPVPIALGGRDPDGSVARVFIVKVPTGGLLYRPDGEPIADRSVLDAQEARQLVFVPAPNFHGHPGPLQYMVEDASGKLSAVATVTIGVSPVNDVPVPGTTLTGPDLTPLPDIDTHHLAGTPDYRWVTAADTPVFGQVRATDVDGDTMAFSAGTAPAHGQLLVAVDGSFVYTPDAGWLGADRFIVTVDDGRGGRASSTVFIDVAAPGATPAASGPDHATAAGLSPAGEGPQPLAQALANPLGFDEIFGRVPAERSATHQVHPDSDVQSDVLQLSALLVGHLPFAPGPGAPPPDQRLDLGLDWGLRGNGLDWLKPPPDQATY